MSASSFLNVVQNPLPDIPDLGVNGGTIAHGGTAQPSAHDPYLDRFDLGQLGIGRFDLCVLQRSPAADETAAGIDSAEEFSTNRAHIRKLSELALEQTGKTYM